MGHTYEHIDADLAAWIEAQRLFFVATAPSGAEGHVNASPKGHDTFRVLGPLQVGLGGWQLGGLLGDDLSQSGGLGRLVQVLIALVVAGAIGYGAFVLAG